VGAERRGERGLTYLELVATAAILLVMASAVLPLAKVTATRQKEIELRRALREMRTAIDRFHTAATELQQIGASDVPLGSEGYPKNLDVLVEGVAKVGTVGGKLKFLRRVPKDPFTNSTEWGLRCYQDDADSDSWCGSNVWDVYTKSKGKGLDGTPYAEW
jgi:general secretion pathway protein G